MKDLSKDSLEGALTALYGSEVHIVGRRPIYGGDINEASRLSLSNGAEVFMKSNTRRNSSFFQAEARGLEALRVTGTIGVPKVLGLGEDREKDRSFLLLEYLREAPRISRYWEEFGRELARMHRADSRRFLYRRVDEEDFSGRRAGTEASSGRERHVHFGFGSDNYIGASVQINTPKETWIDFFRDCRLLPQIRMAKKNLDARMRTQCEKLLDRLDSLLEEPQAPSLLHGDLWSGNAVCGPDGKAWILDPAVYVGHYEAELAMTELFGGFPPSFYGAYHEVNPISPDYQDRRDLYNLYHMLNHLNLFGGSYLSAVRQILNRYV